MSLARTLMNGGNIEEVTVESARYGHADGASIIAMESVEELHDIFLESYNYEQADIAAMTEGVALEGSQYEAVAEAAIKNALTKVKEFFQKLWAKVKAFFANVRRYFDAIFMSGKDFVKKYQKIIDKIDLEDFSYTMYTYNDGAIDNFYSKYPDIDKAAEDCLDTFATVVVDFAKDSEGKDLGPKDEAFEKSIAEIKKATEDDAVAKEFYGVSSADDLDEFLFKKYRKDVDKEERDLKESDISAFAKVLTDSKAIANLDKCQAQSDKMYAKAIKMMTDAEKKADKAKGGLATQVSRMASACASHISKCQTFANKDINAWKSAVKSRDAEYKAAINAAMSASKKKSK